MIETFKYEEFPPDLIQAMENLNTGNAKVAEGNKEVENAKAYITEFFKKTRSDKYKPEEMEIGDMYIANDKKNNTIIVECGKQNRFDEKTFSVENPVLFNKYKKDFKTRPFKCQLSK